VAMQGASFEGARRVAYYHSIKNAVSGTTKLNTCFYVNVISQICERALLSMCFV